MKRSINLDVIRCTACFFVVAVHFFMNTGYYEMPIHNNFMYVGTFLRMFFLTCVPMFLILSGYLMGRKTFSKKYYAAIIKVLVTYLVASIVCLLFNRFYLHSMSFTEGFFGIFNFTTSFYSWYIDMYIGLFLIIPCLNAMFHGMKGKKEKTILLLSFLALTTFPSILNITSREILPNWWETIYPITYYLIGLYIKEIGISLSRKKIFIYMVLCFLFNGFFNILISRGGPLFKGSFNGYQGIAVVFISVMLFLFLLKSNFDKMPGWMKSIVMKVADHSLTIYLVSWISDSFLYPYLNNMGFQGFEKLLFLPLIVSLTFLFAYLIAVFVDFIGNYLIVFISKIYKGIMKYE